MAIAADPAAVTAPPEERMRRHRRNASDGRRPASPALPGGRVRVRRQMDAPCQRIGGDAGGAAADAAGAVRRPEEAVVGSRAVVRRPPNRV
jgi:hypothetical protein